MVLGNQKIKCGVHSCKYNDKINYCSLNDITIGNSTSMEAHNKDETLCSSFYFEQ